MSTTSMPIKTFKGVAAVLPPDRSILIRANHGVGKSKVIRQVSHVVRKALFEKGAIKGMDEYPVIDRRLGQMSEGDLIGLPSTDGNVTRFNPPDWYRQACVAPCALFLDELNRATPEVMQASFQIALDRELNGHKLHPLTRVYSAVNTGASYTVNEVDPALLSRFFVIDLDPTLDEFVAWARDKDPVHGGNLHPSVPDFIQLHSDWLYPPKSAGAGDVHPVPRSWEFVSQSLTHAGIADEPESELFYHICRGYVGNEAAIAFRDFCKTIDTQITADEVVNKFRDSKVQAKYTRQSQDRLNGILDKVGEYVMNLTALTDKQGANVEAFMLSLPDELKVLLWGKLTAGGIDKLDLCKSVHKACAKHVLGVFGVPMGKAGIGVVPNIPGVFKGMGATQAS